MAQVVAKIYAWSTYQQNQEVATAPMVIEPQSKSVLCAPGSGSVKIPADLEENQAFINYMRKERIVRVELIDGANTLWITTFIIRSITQEFTSDKRPIFLISGPDMLAELSRTIILPKITEPDVEDITRIIGLHNIQVSTGTEWSILFDDETVYGTTFGTVHPYTPATPLSLLQSAADQSGEAFYYDGSQFGRTLRWTAQGPQPITGPRIPDILMCDSPLPYGYVVPHKGATIDWTPDRPYITRLSFRGGDWQRNVMVTVTANRPIGSTSLPVTALTRGIPEGTTLNFGGSKTATLRQPAYKNDTTIWVNAIAVAIDNEDHAEFTGTLPLDLDNFDETDPRLDIISGQTLTEVPPMLTTTVSAYPISTEHVIFTDIAPFEDSDDDIQAAQVALVNAASRRLRAIQVICEYQTKYVVSIFTDNSLFYSTPHNIHAGSYVRVQNFDLFQTPQTVTRQVCAAIEVSHTVKNQRRLTTMTLHRYIDSLNATAKRDADSNSNKFLAETLKKFLKFITR